MKVKPYARVFEAVIAVFTKPYFHTSQSSLQLGMAM